MLVDLKIQNNVTKVQYAPTSIYSVYTHTSYISVHTTKYNRAHLKRKLNKIRNFHQKSKNPIKIGVGLGGKSQNADKVHISDNLYEVHII